MAAAAEPKDEGEEEVKGIKMSEVEKHSSIDDLWLVIDGRGGTRLHLFGGRQRRGERNLCIRGLPSSRIMVKCNSPYLLAS